jgi:hypothetical protein
LKRLQKVGIEQISGWNRDYLGAFLAPFSRVLANADIAIVGAPIEYGTPFSCGTKFGSSGLRTLSKKYSLGVMSDRGVVPFEMCRIIDYGEVDVFGINDFALTGWFGEGSIIREVLGREYIDMLGGYGLYSPGIRHPKIVAAVKAQLDRSPQYSQEMLDPLRAHLGKVIARLTPGEIQYGFFANSGTEALEGAEVKFFQPISGG